MNRARWRLGVREIAAVPSFMEINPDQKWFDDDDVMLSKNEDAPCIEEGKTILNIKYMDIIDCSFFSKSQRKSIPFQDPNYRKATQDM